MHDEDARLQTSPHSDDRRIPSGAEDLLGSGLTQGQMFGNIAALRLPRQQPHSFAQYHLQQELAGVSEAAPLPLQHLYYSATALPVPIAAARASDANTAAPAGHAGPHITHAVHGSQSASAGGLGDIPRALAHAGVPPAQPLSDMPHGHAHAPAGMPPAAERSSASGVGGLAQFSPLSLEQLRTMQCGFAAERDWGKFHTPRNLVLALVAEVGELAELFQWKGDASAGKGLPGFSASERSAVEAELSDVLLYLIRLADMCGVDLAAAAVAKLEQNARKYPADRVRGSSAKYTAYTDINPPPPQAPTPHAPPQHAMPSSAHAQQPPPGASHSAIHTLADAASPLPGYAEGLERQADERKRKRFSEAQVLALGTLAEEASWRLQNVSKARREQLCAEWDISHERLINFFNNRKPKDLKVPKRTKARKAEAAPEGGSHPEGGQAEGDTRQHHAHEEESETPEPDGAPHQHHESFQQHDVPHGRGGAPGRHKSDSVPGGWEAGGHVTKGGGAGAGSKAHFEAADTP